ncbi:MAG: sn-glycerol-3-phosphate ABC transporter ATP-binding protein UgpC [Rhodospirillaceae bacterium]|nr:sn-glycerol-3-phosphate ABC transporter ATP-binding protein UgpC [Rhodospirillaceae bacterium]
MAGIVFDRVSKRFGTAEVIRNVDLDIAPGSFTVFVGPSGCGKSTLLRLIAGLEDITAGTLLIEGCPVNDVAPAKRGVAMVFQSYALYPHMSVYQNMAFGLSLAKTDRRETDRRVREAARILQMDHLLERKPKDLSGGQRQRVAIGRAITREPKVFLFDEPLSNLDAALRVQMRLEIAKLHRALGATMVYVTHDQVEAMTLAEQIVVLNAGAVEQVGAPLELYHRPQNRFVAGFIGSPQMNFLPGTLAAAGADGVAVALAGLASPVPAAVAPDGQAAGAAVSLGIRPEHIVVGDGVAAAGPHGRIALVERLGSDTLLHVATQAGHLVVAAGAATKARVGDTIRLGLPADACHVFAADGRALARRGATEA